MKTACLVAGFAAGAVAGWTAARHGHRIALGILAALAIASEVSE